MKQLTASARLPQSLLLLSFAVVVLCSTCCATAAPATVEEAMPEAPALRYDSDALATAAASPARTSADTAAAPAPLVFDLHIVAVSPTGHAADASRLTRDFDARLRHSIDLANAYFDGHLHFRIAPADSGMLYLAAAPHPLPWYYEGYQQGHWERIDQLDALHAAEVATGYAAGAITVYVFDTYSARDSVLLGVTPVLADAAGWQLYERLSPRYDRLYVTYASLGRSTLAHEIGHFFGLPHPWDIAHDARLTAAFGLDDADALCRNAMGYNCYVDGFTPQQLDAATWFALTYRAYLIQ